MSEQTLMLLIHARTLIVTEWSNTKPVDIGSALNALFGKSTLLITRQN